MRANPLAANYLTKDNRWLSFTCLQAGKYWPHICEVIEQPDLATDPRFADHESLMANSVAAGEILRDAFAERSLDEWRVRLADFIGQWTVVQHTLEAAADPQSVANGYIQECKTATGVPFQLVAAPVQYDEQPAVPQRAPEFNEHGDAILTDLGIDWDTIVDLKVRGVVG
jgi:crotonobetainyl-CoA:carnitine CoA-transferase CaiB-like acyl-CoA transferase